MMRLDKTKDGNLISRLENWKFSSALALLREDHPEAIASVVEALASAYSNCGWFDGSIGTIISRAVQSMLPEDELIP